MKKGILILSTLLMAGTAHAQLFTLYASRWLDVNTRSEIKTHSVIYIDSSRITIEQGTSHLYLDIKSQKREGLNFFYTVLDYNDAECHAVFSPEQLTFEYLSGQYDVRYFIDSIVREQQEEVVDNSDDAETADSTSTDSTEADNNIYLTSDTPPEFPGGSDAMKQWINSHTKYPAAARRDKIIGLVEVTAVVERDGTMSDVKVKRDIGGNCGAEAMRVVEEMPTWVPGQIKGEDKRVRTTIKIFFPPE